MHMSKEMTVIALGLFIAVVPYLGIPTAWKTPLLLLAGILLMIVGFLLRGAALSRGLEGSESRPFMESGSARRRDNIEPSVLE